MGSFELHRLSIIQGLMLSRRHRIYRNQWRSHIEKAALAQVNWLGRHFRRGREAHLAVLGAGRLGDLAMDELERAFEEVSLWDFDRSCYFAWHRRRRSSRWSPAFHFHFRDISGVLLSWLNHLERHLSQLKSNQDGFSNSLNFLQTLHHDVPPPAKLIFTTPPSAVISANLLSQIPLAWRDLVEIKLIKKFGRLMVAQNELVWLQAMQASGLSLIEQHLSLLSSSGAKTLLVISDVERCEYPAYLAQASGQAPCAWAEDRGWFITSSNQNGSSSTTLEIVDLLFSKTGVPVAEIQQGLNNYRPTELSDWIWDIEPPIAKSQKKGAVHRVIAVEFERTTGN